jgi:hypothetical protein
MTKRTLSTIQPGVAIAPLNTVSFLPPRTEKVKKQRTYKTRTVSFYLHPRLAERSSRVRALIDEIANRESVLMDETKFTFVDYGVHCYSRGEVPFVTRPNPSVRKLTLVWEESDVWKREIHSKKIQKAPGEKNKYSIAFRGMTNEQSAAMKKEVTSIAEKHAVTPGEVVIVLLEHAVEQYVNGKMSLKKSQPTVENKIDGWGEKTP